MAVHYLNPRCTVLYAPHHYYSVCIDVDQTCISSETLSLEFHVSILSLELRRAIPESKLRLTKRSCLSHESLKKYLTNPKHYIQMTNIEFF